MIDREKIIKEAEETLSVLAPDEVNKRYICLMVKVGWINDVIELLKEQKEKFDHLNNITLEYEKEVFRLQSLLKEQEESMKPRILSLNEAVDADFCWLEDRKTGSVIPVSVFYEGEWTVNAYQPGKCGINYDVAKYGKTYRCWSSRPDEELRKLRMEVK